MRRTEALASVKFYQILSIFIFFIRLIILEDFIRLISYNGPCVRLGCSFFLATEALRYPRMALKVNIHIVGLTKCTVYCKKCSCFCACFSLCCYSCSFLRLKQEPILMKKELFHVNDGLTTSLVFFFGKCQKFGSVRRR